MKVAKEMFISVSLTRVLQQLESTHQLPCVNDWINHLDPLNDFNPEYLGIHFLAAESQMEFQTEAVLRCVKGLLGTKSTLQHLKLWLGKLLATCAGFS